MKLFKPVLRWAEGPEGYRAVALKIADVASYTVEFSAYPGDAEPTTRVAPSVPEGEDEPPELTFLAAIYAVLREPIMTWLAHNNPEVRRFALASADHVLAELVRSIAGTPNSCEHTLELFLRSLLAGVPPALGMVLFAAEIAREQVVPASDFEIALRKRFEGQDPALMARAIMNELPPPGYVYMTPPLPEAYAEALHAELARRKLAAMPAGGSA